MFRADLITSKSAPLLLVMMQKVALIGAKIGREDYSSRSLFLATFP